jgi:hypothetical protein
MLNKIYKSCLLIVVFTVPLFAGAVLEQTDKLLSGTKGIITSYLIPMVFSLAVLFFFYGIVKYIWSVGAGKEEGKKIMVWGVVALFVMSSIWGIIRFFQSEILGGTGGTNMTIPTINSSYSI